MKVRQVLHTHSRQNDYETLKICFSFFSNLNKKKGRDKIIFGGEIKYHEILWSIQLKASTT